MFELQELTLNRSFARGWPNSLYNDSSKAGVASEVFFFFSEHWPDLPQNFADYPLVN